MRNRDDYKVVKGLSVKVHNNDINSALRKFKKKVQEDGLLQTIKANEFYEKPSVKKKKARAAARSRHLKKMEKSSQNQPR